MSGDVSARVWNDELGRMGKEATVGYFVVYTISGESAESNDEIINRKQNF
jgi:hypothetical protein